MAGTSKISAVFDANTSGFVAGTQRVAAALTGLEKNISGMRSSLGTLTAINGAQLFGSIATVTSQAASGLIGMSKAAAESIDAMSKLGTRAGLAYAEVAGLKYAGDLAGVGMDSIANALTKADKAFIAAGNGSKSAVDALATLGLSFEQLNGKASADRFQAIANALAAMPNTAERTAAAIGLFGKSGADLLPLFQDGARGLQAMQAEAKKFGLGLTDLQGKNVEAMNDSFTRAGAAISGIVNQVVSNLAPGVEKVVNLFSSFVAQADGVSLGAQIADGLYEGADFLAGVADGFLSGMSAVWEYVSEVVGAWSSTINIFSRAVQFASGVFSGFEALGNTIGAGLIQITSIMLEAAAAVASALPGGGSWGDSLKQMSRAADEASTKYFNTAAANASLSLKNMGEALGLTAGESVEKSTAPALGKIRQAWREGWELSKDAAKDVAVSGVQAGQQAGVQIRKALEGVKIAAGIDARSSEGYSEFLRLKFGNPSDDANERAADAAEETADNTAALLDKLNFTVMGMV